MNQCGGIKYALARGVGNSAMRASNAILYTEYARRSCGLPVDTVSVEAAANT